MARGMIGRALAGGGEALEAVGFAALKSELDEKRQVRLQELQAQSQRELQDRGFAQQTSERTAGQEFTAGQNSEGRAHQSDLQRSGFRHTEGMQATSLEHAAREHALNRQVQREGQGIQARQVSVLEQGAALDRQVKEIQVKNAKDVEALRTQYQSEKDPEKRALIGENISILTGKDNDKFLPVPLKDDMGNITGYEIFDTKRGAFVAQKPRGGAASPGQRPPLESFFGGKAPGAQPAPARATGQGSAPAPATRPAGMAPGGIAERIMNRGDSMPLQDDEEDPDDVRRRN